MSDIQTFGTTAAREESATRELVDETTHPHQESQPAVKKGAKQLKSVQQHRLLFVKELKLRYEDVEYNEERGMVSNNKEEATLKWSTATNLLCTQPQGVGGWSGAASQVRQSDRTHTLFYCSTYV